MELNIDEQGYDIPNYMSVGDYAKIFKVKDLFTEQYFAAKLVGIITGAPLEKLMKADYEEVNYLAAYIMGLIPTEKQKFVDRFELDGVHYGFIPNWRDLTFAEFVDLDTISTKPATELLDMLHILAAIMYRPIEHEITEHNFLIEEYDIKKMTARAELFKKELDVRYVLGAQTFFISFVEIFSLFPSIFDPEDLRMEEAENSMDAKDNNMEKGFQQAYGWFLVVNRLTSNDFTKHDQIYKKNLNEVLNQLSFLIDYDREQIRLQKKAMNKI